MSLSVSAQAMPKMVGLTAWPGLLHSTAIGVVAPEILPPLGVGPATFDAIASVITVCERTGPPSAPITMIGAALPDVVSGVGVTVSFLEHRSHEALAATS